MLDCDVVISKELYETLLDRDQKLCALEAAGGATNNFKPISKLQLKFK